MGGAYLTSQGCELCPIGMTTASIGATSIDQCGCGLGTYLKDGACESCKGGTTAAVGATLLEQCICPLGFFTSTEIGACASCGCDSVTTR
jgi:hypothetical protein|tara:strand:+ start:608 stop:877 length:270 start_codon:yes stop_codon:yes gene_type:complete